MSKGQASEAVLNYFKLQNRPYSANDVAISLQKDFGKSVIQKALDELSSKGLILEKVYGKQKVYAPKQESNSKEQDMQSELSKLDAEIEEKSKLESKLDEDIKSIEVQLKAMTSMMTSSEALNEEKILLETIEKLEYKLNELSKNPTRISMKEKESVTKNCESVTKEYRKRKRICLDISDAILETYPKSKKVFFEEVGIEPDG